MRFFTKWFVLAVILALPANLALGQAGVTGTLAGTVTQDGTPLPGVTITVTSPNLLGARNTVSNEAGGYSFGALPAGEYSVAFELEGLQTVTRQLRVGVAQNAVLDVDMRLAAVAEAITVTASAAAVATTQEVQTNFTAELIDELPVARTITGITNLAPGVSNQGINGLSISGGMSFDNLYTVNGAVIQENLRGQPHALFIEDAIQETTIQTGAISAEFGNFTGGVVNAITKSGGNEFTGSLRDSLTNPSWTAVSPNFYRLNPQREEVTPPDPPDVLNEVYEGTFGGRIIRDRLWFFTAGRFTESEGQQTFSSGGAPYATTTENRRWEGKLTGAITSSHNLVASYLENPVQATNDCQIGCYDETALDPVVENPNSFWSAFYNGILTDNLLVEAKYSKKDYAFVGYGGDDKDLFTGTPVRLTAPGFSTSTNEAFFCGSCGDEIRDNDQVGVKVTYFLGSRSFGTHNIVAGAERWHETRLANNYQTPNEFVFRARTLAPRRGPNGTLISVKGGQDFIEYRPIRVLSQGSDLNTNSFYVNDRWNLNTRWSFQLGARYDANDSTDSSGNTVANDSKFSPRLGVTLDPFANGRFHVRAGYGVYVGRLAENITALGSSAGNNEVYQYLYNGPDLIDMSAPDALRQVFAHFQTAGVQFGTQHSSLIGLSIPGASNQIRDSLTSPNVQEYTLGVSSSFNRGFVRLDYVDRTWADFYDLARNLQTGRIKLPSGTEADLGLVVNNDEGLSRDYRAIELQTQYRALDRLLVGANYTLSRLQSNFTGETSTSGPVVFGSPSIFLPEYYNWPGGENAPRGLADLEDQTHRLRAYASFDLPTPVGNFNVSALHRFESGRAYGLFGSIDVRQNANFYGTGRPGGVSNPGYLASTVPTSVTYWFAEPGDYRFDDFNATDLALNYNTNPGWLRGVTFFAQAELINSLNNSAQTGGSRAVLTHLNCPAGATSPAVGCPAGGLQRFNPFVDEPVKGVHWVEGPLFGLPTAATTANATGSFQAPRTYRFSLGLRF